MTSDTTRRRWWGALGLLVVLDLGCSGRPTSNDEGNETSNADESSGESASTSGAGMSDGLDGTTEAAACEWEPAPLAPMDLEPAPECTYLVSSGEAAPVTLRFVNEGDEVVWLTGPGPCTNVYASVEDAAGQLFSGTHCTLPCEAALLGECGCLSDCPLVDTIALEPGGAFETEWPGYVLEVERQEATMECAGEACAGECSLRTAPAEGMMRVTAAKAMALECDDDCACEPNASGWCVAPGRPTDAEFVERVELDVEWPLACPVIELVVQ